MTPSIASKASDMFSINLSDDSIRGLRVQSVEILSPDLRQKLSFRGAMDLKDVFVPLLANRLERVLSRISDGNGVHTKPDLVITFPGLVLARLRILVHRTPEGARQVLMRFKYFIGGLQNAFRVQTHFTEPSLLHREKLAIEALTEIATPLFDIANAALASDQVEDIQRALQEHLLHLSENAQELSFYLTMLARYASEAAQTREQLAVEKIDPLAALR